MRQNSYLIGRINNTHGIKGALKVQSFSDFDRFFVGAVMFILADNKETILEIEKCTATNKGYLVFFKGITTVEQALPLKGKELYSKSLPDTNELHFSDLLDLEVILDTNEPFGIVSNVIDNGCQTVIEITKSNQQKTLIPFVSAHIKGIKHKKLVIYDIEGL